MDTLPDVISVMPQERLSIFFICRIKSSEVAPYLEKKPYIGLKDVPLFMTARVADGTVLWPGNGEDGKRPQEKTDVPSGSY